MVDYYCLKCHLPINKQGHFHQRIMIDDVLCCDCRSKLLYYPKQMKINALKVESLYIYKDELREMLIQYKEYNDQALFPIFLYPYIEKLQKKYRDYYLVPVPSSKDNYQKRGFHHVEMMFSLLQLPIINCFVKADDSQQKLASYSQRQEIAKSIKLVKPIRDKKILLIDDIVTTGASLESCYKQLVNDNQEVKALAIAYNESYLSKKDQFLIRIDF